MLTKMKMTSKKEKDLRNVDDFKFNTFQKGNMTSKLNTTKKLKTSSKRKMTQE